MHLQSAVYGWCRRAAPEGSAVDAAKEKERSAPVVTQRGFAAGHKKVVLRSTFMPMYAQAARTVHPELSRHDNIMAVPRQLDVKRMLCVLNDESGEIGRRALGTLRRARGNTDEEGAPTVFSKSMLHTACYAARLAVGAVVPRPFQSPGGGVDAVTCSRTLRRVSEYATRLRRDTHRVYMTCTICMDEAATVVFACIVAMYRYRTRPRRVGVCKLHRMGGGSSSGPRGYSGFRRAVLRIA